MRLKALNIKDKKHINKFLNLKQHNLCIYAFQNIYIWKSLFKIYLTEIKDNLCIFLEDSAGIFLYLPPLGKAREADVVEEAFKVMDGKNKNRQVSRIENVEEDETAFYESLGFKISYKSCDYVCNRNSLAQLKGDKFKHKRSAYNYFIKHYKFEYLPFDLRYKKDCLKLYDAWMEQRKSKNKDKIYQAMLEDNREAFKTMLDSYKYLDCVGRIVKADGELKAFTFGYELSHDTFCILYEITDLEVKGLAQFIFRKFCDELKYRFINIMDDSGLENIRRAKLSYYPQKAIPAYIVKRAS